MTITITVPDEIGTRLRRKAEAEHRSVEGLALDILASALEIEDSVPTPEEVVAKIQATPPNPRSIRPASGSLADALRSAGHDPGFDLAAWQKEWAAVEGQMKGITLANDADEGRG